ncbi:MAG: substrate-binding domain-containing protein, partial [Eubacteriales bacterium]|nr:substrate-binding domain-containing protein [Eubacteriales bacterium]
DAHQERGIRVNNALMFMEVKDYRNASWAVEQILRAGADGIVCMDDSICNLVLGCLREKGVDVPSVLKLASLYDSRQMERNVPAVTSIYFDTKELGRKACMKMLEMLGENMEEEQCALAYQVILRESTK